MRSFLKFLDWIDDIIVSNCVCCSGLVRSGLICSNCKAKLLNFKHPLATKLERKSKYLSAIFYVWEYESIAGKLLKKFKFKGDFLCWDLLKESLDIYLDRYGSLLAKERAILTYVPMHWIKQVFVRGFNPSYVIADYIGKKLAVDVVTLARSKLNVPQHWLKSKRIRKLLSVGKFFSNVDCLDFLAGCEKVIIVDDIVTTGLTLEEMAKVIRDFGVKEIEGFVLCG